jgi:hypothetical protein
MPASHGCGSTCRGCKKQPVLEAVGLDVSETAPTTTRKRQRTPEYVTSIVDWLRQFTVPMFSERRFKPIVLIGDVGRRHWRHAVEHSGPKVFRIECSALKGTDSPDLSGFDRDIHSCVVFENIRRETVLSNTLIFSSHMKPLELNRLSSLAQYSGWLYMVPMMLCTDEFSMDATGPSAECAEWLSSSVLLAEPIPASDDVCCLWSYVISLAVVLFERLPGRDI